MKHPPLIVAMIIMTSGMGVAAGNAQAVDAAAAPTLEQIKDAKVRGIYDSKVIDLENGVYDGAPFVSGGASRPRVELMVRLTAAGDLDGASGEDRVVFLVESSGAAGANIFLGVFRMQGGQVENTGTVLVGNRVQLRRLDIDKSTIVLDVLEAGQVDPMCCPTRLARKFYQMVQGGLKQIASEVTGTLSLAAIADVEWTLEEWNGQPLAPGSQTPTFTVAGGTAGGFGGCNRYSGAVKESAPGKISLGELASTQMACADARMSLEGGFLEDLKSVTTYAFLEGRLALRWQDGGRNGLLLFRR